MKILPSLLQKLFPRRFGVDAISTTADRYFDDFPSHSTQAGERINADSANRISTYYACKQVISQDVGKLPLVLFRREANGNRTRATDHPLYTLMHDKPNRDMTAVDWISTMQGHLVLRGKAFSQKVISGAGRILELIPLHPDRMQFEREENERSPDFGHIKYTYTTSQGPEESHVD